MKKTLLKSALMALAGIGLMAGSAMALPFNEGRPYDSGNLDYTGGNYIIGDAVVGEPDEVSLQTIFNDKISGAFIDAIADQSSAAIWQSDEGAIDTYLVSLLTGGSSNLYIYSNTTGASHLLVSSSATTASFAVNDEGKLLYGETLIDANFGQTFGFCYGTSCTEDDMNDGAIKALSYQLQSGLSISTLAYGGFTFNTNGGNDWILAFEDWTDNDFQDAVFVVEDLAAVPEPATMLLFGTGLAGLAGIARRRKK